MQIIQNNKKILLALGLVIVVLIGGFFAFKDRNDQSSLAADFENGPLITEVQLEIPEHIRTRFEEELEEHRADQETAENKYQPLMGEALMLIQFGRYQEALTKLEAMEEMFPQDELISQNRGDLLVKMGQYYSAALVYTQAIDKKPLEALSHLKLAEHYERYSNDPLKAEGIYRRAIADTRGDKEVFRRYAVFLEETKKDYQEAVSYWERVLEKTSDIQRSNAIHEKILELRSK